MKKIFLILVAFCWICVNPSFAQSEAQMNKGLWVEGGVGLAKEWYKEPGGLFFGNYAIAGYYDHWMGRLGLSQGYNADTRYPFMSVSIMGGWHINWGWTYFDIAAGPAFVQGKIPDEDMSTSSACLRDPENYAACHVYEFQTVGLDWNVGVGLGRFLGLGLNLYGSLNREEPVVGLTLQARLGLL